MPFQFVIVSEDPEMASALSDSAGRLRPAWNSVQLDDYAAVGKMRGELAACDQSTLAMIVAISDADRAVYLLQAVKQVFPEITTAAAHPAPSSDLIIAAMRAGASEFLTPPYDLAPLAERVERDATPAEEEPAAGKLFCFIPAKGASGASTLGIHSAKSLAQVLDDRVLFVDFDFHSGVSAFRLRLKPAYTLADALERTGQVDELWKQLVTPWKMLDVLPAPTSPSSIPVAVYDLVPQFFQAAQRRYPCVVVDLPSAVLSSCRDVMSLADCVFLVCTPEVISLHLAKRKLDKLLQMGIRNERIELVVNRVNSGRALDADDISKLVGKKVFWSFSNDYEALTEASLRGDLLKNDTVLGREFNKFASTIVSANNLTAKSASKTEKTRSWSSFFSLK